MQRSPSPTAAATYFYQQLRKIRTSEAPVGDRIGAIWESIEQLLLLVTRDTKLNFSSPFARMAYAVQTAGADDQVSFALHQFRRTAQRGGAGADTLQLGLYALAHGVATLLKQPLPTDLAADLPAGPRVPAYARGPEELRVTRAVLLDLDPQNEELIAQLDGTNGNLVRVRYNVGGINENFAKTIRILELVVGFPATVNLLGSRRDEAGRLVPAGIILEPDYLIDVTAIASQFSNAKPEPILYLLGKFLPHEVTEPLMLGNIANFFLDEMMTDRTASFREVFPKVFQLNPLQFSLLDDKEVKSIAQKSQRHWLTLKQVTQQEFEKQEIGASDCYLEPSFYSAQFGLQGRLDVLHRTGSQTSIVELKSGKPFNPTNQGIGKAHFVQTLLYDLMIRSAFGREERPRNFILYSGESNSPLRYAPVVRMMQLSALQVRNEIVGLEIQLQRGALPNPIFNRLRTDRYPKLGGYLAQNLARFETAYQKATDLDRHYFSAFAGFVAREQMMSKTGAPDAGHLNGLSGLWRDPLPRKEARFAVFSYLTIAQKDVQSEHPTIRFRRTERTNELANFRRGDVMVLYPMDHAESNVLSHQIFKCTIIEVTPESVSVLLRCRQFNEGLFNHYEYWNLEGDSMDSGFRSMHRSLFGFLESPAEKRELLLGQRPPRRGEYTRMEEGKMVVPEHPRPVKPIRVPDELTHEQGQIFRRVLLSEEYFLLWGPPGTGKTSRMLKNLVRHLVETEGEEVLLLSFTNRSVNEMCEALQSAGLDFLRIGSTHGTQPEYRKYLLQTRTEGLQRRTDLRAVVERHRVVVSTVSSLLGKPELLALKNFSRVIVDEASQIPEPMLVGLLPQFDKFVLIGDHLQLPAVVQQPPADSYVDYEPLRELGLTDLRNSLFERLYKRCIDQKWNWAYSQLTHQGRMHEQIMDFPGRRFYRGKLKILPSTVAAYTRQLAPLKRLQPADCDELTALLCQHRVLFFNTESDGGMRGKTNADEAELVARILSAYQNIHACNELQLRADSIGIITPYRAQIALLRQRLRREEIPMDQLTIDTGERYQGGARDVIILSLCTNSVLNLEQMISLNDEAVDRKLNVALTRAREQVIILGNEEILRTNRIYAALLDYVETLVGVAV